MRTADRMDHEQYAFSCPHCGQTWICTYQIREERVSAGHRLRVFYLDGFPVAPPRFGVSCRSCGGYGVKVAPLSEVA